MQGQIEDLGAARSKFRESGTGPGYRLLRQMILSASQEVQTEFGLQPFQNHFASLPLVLVLEISRKIEDEDENEDEEEIKVFAGCGRTAAAQAGRWS